MTLKILTGQSGEKLVAFFVWVLKKRSSGVQASKAFFYTIYVCLTLSMARDYLLDNKYKVTKQDCNDGGCYFEYFFEDRNGRIIRHRDRAADYLPDALDPDGAENIPFVLERNTKSWGISFEYSAGNSPIQIFDSVLVSMLNKEKKEYGYDGCIIVTVVMVPCCCAPEIIFQGLIDFYISSFVNCQYWEIQLRKEAFSAKFENRLDVKVGITDTRDVDGNSISISPVHPIGLHSQAILKAYQGTNSGNANSCVYPLASGGGAPPFTFFSIPLESVQTNSIGWSDGTGFTMDEDAVVSININSLTVANVGGCNPLITAQFAYSVDNVETVVGTYIAGGSALGSAFPYSLNIFLLEGQTFNIYFKINNLGQVNDCQPEICFFHTIFDIKYISYEQPSCAQSMWIHDYLSQQLKLLCGPTARLVAPDLGFDTLHGYQEAGCYAENKILNGHWLRQNIDEERAPRQTMQYLLDSMRAIFAMGYSIESDAQGDYIRIDDCDFYFNDQEGLRIKSEDIIAISYEAFPEFTYNQLLLGYSKSAINSDDTNSLDEIHDKSEWLLCVTRNKNALEAISPMIASGQLIEKKRRESFASTPNSSSSFDQDLFIVSSYHLDSITGDITFNFLQDRSLTISENLVLCPGQTITISGAGAQDGIYTVTGIDYDAPNTTLFLNQDPGAFVTAIGATITIDGGICQAYRDEQFDDVQNITAPETAYNLIHTPVRQLFRWGKWINSSQKPLTPCTYRWQAGEGGRDLKTQIKSTVCFDCDNTQNLRQESTDILSGEICGGESKFCPELVKVSIQYSKERLDFLRKNKYNYISVENPCLDCGESEIIRGWLMKAEFKPFSDNGSLELELIRKSE